MPISKSAKDAKNLAKLYKVHERLVNEIKNVEAQIKQLQAQQQESEEEESSEEEEESSEEESSEEEEED